MTSQMVWLRDFLGSYAHGLVRLADLFQKPRDPHGPPSQRSVVHAHDATLTSPAAKAGAKASERRATPISRALPRLACRIRGGGVAPFALRQRGERLVVACLLGPGFGWGAEAW